ncbi:membrane transporter [Schizosaccharomyces octosporus yFS286]|uniref:Membrane transporter n=1 Tax=Schizosaccharomyces octosporus (strain yFS286) TaxID=483514 RepID=S9RDL6_SCHOY|nr:membrane transporter [Schizosaccharomyces octosporus yFS286]EPX72159.1 membrane transporter [Schizosaccharomyces octosporus yFS286]
MTSLKESNKDKASIQNAEIETEIETETVPLQTTTSVSSNDDLFDSKDFDQVYLAKSRILSQAIDELGFGKYQWALLFIAGFGWMSDNSWPVVTSLILSRLNEVNGVHPPTPKDAPFLTLAQNLGFLAGASFWSISSDIFGRLWAFNYTFLITGVFSLVAGASPNFAAIGIFNSLWSFGVGGNLPVDSAIFIEAIPSSYQWLLTVMSAWWALGQVLVNLIAWGLVANYSCSDDKEPCYKENNKGWRYLLFTMGGLTLFMFLIRFLFPLVESPGYLLAKGREQEAVQAVHKIAKYNKKESSLSLQDFQKVQPSLSNTLESQTENDVLHTINNSPKKEALKRVINFQTIRECFRSKRLILSSTLVISSWALIGLAFPLYNAFLPYYLESRGNANKPLSVYETYRNSLIVSTLGVPGSLLAGILVELRIGRKGTLTLSLLLTGVFLFASTTAKTSNAYLGWNCAFTFVSDIMYGVLYAYTPEVFPSKVRGTAIGLASSANRVLGVFAPIIAMYANLTTSAPIFVSGALFLFAGLLTIFFPYEPRGKSSF